MLTKVKKFFTLENIIVLGILVIAFILRIYRVDQTLAFHYDQGRDALVIWDLIHTPHKFFLIGPTTGLAGVFRGPFYYYLIAPFYFLGQGNPVWPSVFLAFTSTLALYLMYVIAKEVAGVKAGIIALVLGTVSFEIIYASRWLSNPTPMLLLSMLLVLSMFRIYEGRKNYWILLSAVLGLSFFSFGSSGELFYFPVVGIFAVWSLIRQGFGKAKSTLNWKVISLSLVVFLATFAPLFIFNARHGNILQNNVAILMGTGNSFGLPSWRFANDRAHLVGTYFSALIFHSPYDKESVYAFVLLIVCVYFLSRVIKNDKVRILVGFLVSVFIGLVFFQGNHGNLYAYYLTGYYLIFLLVIGIILSKIFENSLIGKIIVIYFLSFFMIQNAQWIKPYINAKGEDANEIILSNQKKTIDWIYQNSNGRDFNVDTYVPPVIPYSYDYLVKWIGSKSYKKLPSDSQVPLLYTIHEADPEHPERIEAWLARQQGIGSVVKSQTFGGITVEERIRIIKK